MIIVCSEAIISITKCLASMIDFCIHAKKDGNFVHKKVRSKGEYPREMI